MWRYRRPHPLTVFVMQGIQTTSVLNMNSYLPALWALKSRNHLGLSSFIEPHRVLCYQPFIFHAKVSQIASSFWRENWKACLPAGQRVICAMKGRQTVSGIWSDFTAEQRWLTTCEIRPRHMIIGAWNMPREMNWISQGSGFLVNCFELFSKKKIPQVTLWIFAVASMV